MNYEKEAQINEEKKEEEEEEKEEIFDKANEYSFYKKLEKILKEQAKEKKKKSDEKQKNVGKQAVEEADSELWECHSLPFLCLQSCAFLRGCFYFRTQVCTGLGYFCQAGRYGLSVHLY